MIAVISAVVLLSAALVKGAINSVLGLVGIELISHQGSGRRPDALWLGKPFKRGPRYGLRLKRHSR